jgi:Holliday junction resolvasome RuvABC ATP-dependent DNA helicase subunit
VTEYVIEIKNNQQLLLQKNTYTKLLNTSYIYKNLQTNLYITSGKVMLKKISHIAMLLTYETQTKVVTLNHIHEMLPNHCNGILLKII